MTEREGRECDEQEEEGREVEVMDRNGCGCMCAWVRTCCLVLFLLLARARDNIVDSKNETSTAFLKQIAELCQKLERVLGEEKEILRRVDNEEQ